jgi:gas vesicle protein
MIESIMLFVAGVVIGGMIGFITGLQVGGSRK